MGCYLRIKKYSKEEIGEKGKTFQRLENYFKNLEKDKVKEYHDKHNRRQVK